MPPHQSNFPKNAPTTKTTTTTTSFSLAPLGLWGLPTQRAPTADTTDQTRCWDAALSLSPPPSPPQPEDQEELPNQGGVVVVEQVTPPPPPPPQPRVVWKKDTKENDGENKDQDEEQDEEDSDEEDDDVEKQPQSPRGFSWQSHYYSYEFGGAPTTTSKRSNRNNYYYHHQAYMDHPDHHHHDDDDDEEEERLVLLEHGSQCSSHNNNGSNHHYHHPVRTTTMKPPFRTSSGGVTHQMSIYYLDGETHGTSRTNHPASSSSSSSFTTTTHRDNDNDNDENTTTQSFVSATTSSSFPGPLSLLSSSSLAESSTGGEGQGQGGGVTYSISTTSTITKSMSGVWTNGGGGGDDDDRSSSTDNNKNKNKKKGEKEKEKEKRKTKNNKKPKTIEIVSDLPNDDQAAAARQPPWHNHQGGSTTTTWSTTMMRRCRRHYPWRPQQDEARSSRSSSIHSRSHHSSSSHRSPASDHDLDKDDHDLDKDDDDFSTSKGSAQSGLFLPDTDNDNDKDDGEKNDHHPDPILLVVGEDHPKVLPADQPKDEHDEKENDEKDNPSSGNVVEIAALRTSQALEFQQRPRSPGRDHHHHQQQQDLDATVTAVITTPSQRRSLALHRSHDSLPGAAGDEERKPRDNQDRPLLLREATKEPEAGEGCPCNRNNYDDDEQQWLALSGPTPGSTASPPHPRPNNPSPPSFYPNDNDDINNHQSQRAHDQSVHNSPTKWPDSSSSSRSPRSVIALSSIMAQEEDDFVPSKQGSMIPKGDNGHHTPVDSFTITDNDCCRSGVLASATTTTTRRTTTTAMKKDGAGVSSTGELLPNHETRSEDDNNNKTRNNQAQLPDNIHSHLVPPRSLFSASSTAAKVDEEEQYPMMLFKTQPVTMEASAVILDQEVRADDDRDDSSEKDGQRSTFHVEEENIDGMDDGPPRMMNDKEECYFLLGRRNDDDHHPTLLPAQTEHEKQPQEQGSLKTDTPTTTENACTAAKATPRMLLHFKQQTPKQLEHALAAAAVKLAHSTGKHRHGNGHNDKDCEDYHNNDMDDDDDEEISGAASLSSYSLSSANSLSQLFSNAFLVRHIPPPPSLPDEGDDNDTEDDNDTDDEEINDSTNETGCDMIESLVVEPSSSTTVTTAPSRSYEEQAYFGNEYEDDSNASRCERVIEVIDLSDCLNDYQGTDSGVPKIPSVVAPPTQVDSWFESDTNDAGVTMMEPTLTKEHGQGRNDLQTPAVDGPHPPSASETLASRKKQRSRKSNQQSPSSDTKRTKGKDAVKQRRSKMDATKDNTCATVMDQDDSLSVTTVTTTIRPKRKPKKKHTTSYKTTGRQYQASLAPELPANAFASYTFDSLSIDSLSTEDFLGGSCPNFSSVDKDSWKQREGSERATTTTKDDSDLERAQSVIASLRRQVDRLQNTVDQMRFGLHDIEYNFRGVVQELKTTVREQDTVLDRQAQHIRILYAKNATMEENLKTARYLLSEQHHLLQRAEQLNSRTLPLSCPMTPSPAPNSTDRSPSIPLRQASGQQTRELKNHQQQRKKQPRQQRKPRSSTQASGCVPANPRPNGQHSTSKNMMGNGDDRRFEATASTNSSKKSTNTYRQSTTSSSTASTKASSQSSASSSVSSSPYSSASSSLSSPYRNPVKLLGVDTADEKSIDEEDLLPTSSHSRKVKAGKGKQTLLSALQSRQRQTAATTTHRNRSKKSTQDKHAQGKLKARVVSKGNKVIRDCQNVDSDLLQNFGGNKHGGTFALDQDDDADETNSTFSTGDHPSIFTDDMSLEEESILRIIGTNRRLLS
ncbi:hypothetical protein ACA910_012540 [Epithemia clementina (nom. ined.)]